jgi:hypothetical protein
MGDDMILETFLTFFLSLISVRILIVRVEDYCCTLKDTYTLGRSPLDEGSAFRRDLYPTTHYAHKNTDIPSPAEFEPAIPESECGHQYWQIRNLGSEILNYCISFGADISIADTG